MDIVSTTGAVRGSAVSRYCEAKSLEMAAEHFFHNPFGKVRMISVPPGVSGWISSVAPMLAPSRPAVNPH